MAEPEDTLPTARTASQISSFRQAADPLPALTLLAHPDPERVGDRALLPALVMGEGLELGRLAPAFEKIGPGSGPSRPLDDPCLSRQPIRIRRHGDGHLVLDTEGTSTRLRIDGREVEGSGTVGGDALRRGVVLGLGSRLALLLHETVPSVVPPPQFGLVGESSAMWRLRREMAQVSDLEIPVLLRGESGTGKELVARALRDAGPRHAKPYHAINMAAVPPTLAASELFGAAKGAYSGATERRAGFFERAHEGTLFLDEVGETPVEVQAALLRVLESGEIQPVGAAAARSVDVRVIAATDANLEGAIAEGNFRAPLLHRLAGFEIELPPLRERRDDIGRLFFHFLRHELEAVGEPHRLRDPGRGRPYVPAELLGRLVGFEWPGNVRQLRNVVRQLVIGSRGQGRLEMASRVEKLLTGGTDTGSGSDPAVVSRAPSGTPAHTGSGDRPADGAESGVEAPEEAADFRDPSEVDEDELVATLRAHQFRIQPTAKALRLSRTALYRLIEACPRIRKAADLRADEIEAARESEDGRLPRMAEALGVSLQGLKRRIRDLDLQS